MLFSAGQDVRLKKLRRTNLFLSMVFKHGLLEGSTFLFQYSYTSGTPLESFRLGELEYAISAGYDIRLKNKSLERAKNDISRQAYMVTVVWAACGIDIFFDTATQARHRWIALD